VRAGIVDADHNLTDVTRALIELFADRRSIKRQSHVSDLDVRWDRTVEPGSVTVEFCEAVPPDASINLSRDNELPTHSGAAGRRIPRR
jgi:hypothetical protein